MNNYLGLIEFSIYQFTFYNIPFPFEFFTLICVSGGPST